MQRRCSRPSQVAVAAACAAALGPAGAEGQSPGTAACGTFEYAYPYNTDRLSENHLIVLECDGESVRGRYHGTSDDFDPGREGYLPGFFVTEMQGLVVEGGRIRFTLRLAEGDYFASPVPLPHRSTAEAMAAGLPPWRAGARAGRVEYAGRIEDGSIVLEVGGVGRTFHRRAPAQEEATGP